MYSVYRAPLQAAATEEPRTLNPTKRGPIGSLRIEGLGLKAEGLNPKP